MSTVYNGKELKPIQKGKIEEKYKQYENTKHNSLVIKRVVGVTDHSLPIVEVVCNCGMSILRSLRRVLDGSCISCGCLDKNRPIRTMVGDVFINMDGDEAVVVEVRSSIDIDLKFLACGTVATFSQNALKSGSFKNRNKPAVYGVGFIGFGEYSLSTHPQVYKRWQSMLQRCYDPTYQENCPTYQGCSVFEEWHNFQNFAKWFCLQENYSENTNLQLDKDLIEKGNKVYSSEKCCLLPKEVNALIITNILSRGELPIGVIWHKRDKQYRAQMTCTIDGKKKNIHICSSNDPMECFLAYKKYKENYFKVIAERYKDNLTKIAYNALISREVDPND